MKASVSLITYNHAPYIAQAIESVLMQQTRFDFELLIGEDDSKDGTRDIVKQYQARYPERIRLLLLDRKNVAYVNGQPTGQWNFANNIRNTRGQYVALLDGDDYWTSPHKLQKQVDFLEANPDCALCFHNIHVRDESDPGKLDLFHAGPMRARYEIGDLLKVNFIPACSVMFRSGLFGDFPPWFFKCRMGDWPLHVLNAKYGRIGYLDEVMAVYRKHAGGLWSNQTSLQIFLDNLQAAECIRTCLEPSQQRELDGSMAGACLQTLKEYRARGDSKVVDRLAKVYLKRFLFCKEAKPFKVLRYLMLARFRIFRGADSLGRK